MPSINWPEIDPMLPALIQAGIYARRNRQTIQDILQ